MLSTKLEIGQKDASIQKISKYGCYMYVAAYFTLLRNKVRSLPDLHNLVRLGYEKQIGVDADCYVSSIRSLVNSYCVEANLTARYMPGSYNRDVGGEGDMFQPIVKFGKNPYMDIHGMRQFHVTHFLYWDGINFYDPLQRSLASYSNWELIYTSNWNYTK